MAIEDKPRRYSIPENYIDESRLINGMFRTRNFIEGVTLAAFAAILVTAIPIQSFNLKIIIYFAACVPLLFIGFAGFNGKPLSKTLVNARKWKTTKGVMLYDKKVHPLIKSPLQAQLDKIQPRDRLVDVIDAIKERQAVRNQQLVLIEGETFEFVKDKEFEDIRADNYEILEGYEDENGDFIPIKRWDLISVDNKKEKRHTRERTDDENQSVAEAENSFEKSLDLDAIFNDNDEEE